MIENLTSLFRIPERFQLQRIENDRTWYELQNSINGSMNATINSINAFSNLGNANTEYTNLLKEKQLNCNMKLALEIQSERKQLLELSKLQ